MNTSYHLLTEMTQLFDLLGRKYKELVANTVNHLILAASNFGDSNRLIYWLSLILAEHQHTKGICPLIPYCVIEFETIFGSL